VLCHLTIPCQVLRLYSIKWELWWYLWTEQWWRKW